MSNDATLYILMRSDMESMNPGKAMAQAAHAANAFTNDVAGADDAYAVTAWGEQTTQGFGTTIVLNVEDGGDLESLVNQCWESGFMAGVIHDPTYPVRDGYVTHLIPLNTCAYVFTPSRSERPVEAIEHLGLHP